MTTLKSLTSLLILVAVGVAALLIRQRSIARDAAGPDPASLSAPAGMHAAAQHFALNADGQTWDAAILPSGRFATPVGREIGVRAPKPFGMAVSPDGKTVATVNSGVAPFSVTLIRNFDGPNPEGRLVKVDSSFMGLAFSGDSSRFYVGGGEDGLVWVGDTAAARIVGAVNLNASVHAIAGPLDVTQPIKPKTLGAFPGALALGKDGRFLYVLDQAAFTVAVIDTAKIKTGIDAQGRVTEPNNAEAIAGQVKIGRYPFGIGIAPDGGQMFVANVGMFEYTHFTPEHPTGDENHDYPLGIPGAGYPDETRNDRTIDIEKVDPASLPPTLSIPNGVRVGYVKDSSKFRIPGLGDPNVAESSSVYALTISASKALPSVAARIKTGPRVGENDGGIGVYSGSHPNAIAAAPNAVYVSNGNDDTVSIVDPKSHTELHRVSLSVFTGKGRDYKGVQPVGLALSPDYKTLYVAEAGINAVGVLELRGTTAVLKGHIPAGWWPSAVNVSADGKTLFIVSANGRGSTPNTRDDRGDPKSTSYGIVQVLPVPSADELKNFTARVMANNGFVPTEARTPLTLPPQIKHVIFLNKENSTYDQLLGDLTKSRTGAPLDGNPAYSLGYDASPNHHELALQFTVGDNFFLEPSCSSDGHRWLTDNYPTEFEQTNWPAVYGDRRSEAGDDPKVYKAYPGRLGFTGADSPEPNDYDQHGGVYLHLVRNGRTIVNFGNGFELSETDEAFGTEPTGLRSKVNVPMEKVVRDNTDQLYSEFNTHIPDAPQANDPKRYNRFSRFKQVFEALYVDPKTNACKLPNYVDLNLPNDHGGSANDINPKGPPWSYKRFVQDNDDALGRTVELISHSPCWKDTVIFVVEDDVQNGMDHVDGSRSIFLAISPWVKRQYVARVHYSLSSVFKTVYEILGVPPLNQYDLAATDLRDVFTATPDFTPYTRLPLQFAKGASKTWIALSKQIDFRHPDADEVRLRRAILLSEHLPR